MSRSAIFALAGLMAWAATVNAGVTLQPHRSSTRRQPDEILIKWRAGVLAARGNGGSRLAALGIERRALASGQVAAQAAQAYQNRADVLWAQPNYWRAALATDVVPNDPYYRPERNERRYQQWYLPKINANFAWSLARGNDALVVAVVDSGVDLQHPDLQGRLAPGVTLVRQSGYDPPADGMDDNGHGTHVAGIIAAAVDNALGIAACSWSGTVLPVKVLNADGDGTDADVAEGILYAADHGAKIINLSLGGPTDTGPPPALQAAVDYAYTQGCLVIAASGNSGDRTVYYPAALNHVVAVAATDPWDQRASYSSFYPEVDLAAPGGSGDEAFSKDTGILSTFWNENSRVTDFMGGSDAGEYAITAGTSMAAAVASGAALVVWSRYPGWTADQIEQALKNTAADVGPAGPDEETGMGRIDLLAALGASGIEWSELSWYAYPNPFHPGRNGVQHLVFFLDRPAGVQIRIYDAARDLVREFTLSAAETLAGKNQVSWDGRNGVGRTVANGAYYVRITTDDGQVSRIKAIAVLQ